MAWHSHPHFDLMVPLWLNVDGTSSLMSQGGPCEARALLLQDMASWTRDGIAGLQSVVLYSLPELDGAIDTIPLGGLVNNDIFLVPERVQRLAARLKKWVDLRRTPLKASHRRFVLSLRLALLSHPARSALARASMELLASHVRLWVLRALNHSTAAGPFGCLAC